MVMKMVHIDIAVRKKIVRAREKGLRAAEICEAYDVGKSAVYALLKQARETGDITPKLHLRGRKPSYSEEDVASIKSLIDAQCDITAGEIKERLELKLCESSIRTIIREKSGCRYKKRRYMPVNESAPTQWQRERRGVI